MDVEKFFLKGGFTINVYCSGLELELAEVECVDTQQLLATLFSLPPGLPSVARHLVWLSSRLTF